MLLKSVSVLLALSFQFAPAAFAEPAKIIFDTDMGNDIDDALALAVIHSLQNRAECDLLAVTTTKDADECAPYVDAVNTFYGRGDIPIGEVVDGVTMFKSKFLPVGQIQDDGEYRYSHDLQVGFAVPEAVGLLRKTLAAQEDGSVIVVQVGFSTNLARLLMSEADEHSDLSGMELVKRKVSTLSIMAGAFQPLNGKPHREFNIIMDKPAAKSLIENWPTPIVWSGFEIGLAIRFPAISIDEEFKYVDHHIIQESYQAYMPTPHERPTFDLTSVLWAVRPNHGYFTLSEPGRVTMNEHGETTFEAQEGGRDRYMTVTADQIQRTREVLAALASEPPK
jgi:inosine-uridine nucleoside N-ribohydrolase